MNRKSIALSAAAYILIAAAVLTACDKKTASVPTPAPPSGSLAPLGSLPRGNNQRIAYDCGNIHPARAPAGSPPDDILGVRAGMKPEYARAVLACTDPRYAFSDSRVDGNFGVPPLPNGTFAQTGFSAEIGDGTTAPSDHVDVIYVGYPGEEVVAGVSRAMHFPPGQQPPFDRIRSAIVGKYGDATKTAEHATSYDDTLTWIGGPDGKPLARGGLAFATCNASNQGFGFSISSECGLTNVASIGRSQDNPQSVQGFSVKIIDQAKTSAIPEAAKARVKATRGGGGTLPQHF